VTEVKGIKMSGKCHAMRRLIGERFYPRLFNELDRVIRVWV